MRSAARFHSDKARGPVREMFEKRSAPDGLVHNLASVVVYVMHLENSLCNVDSNWCQIHR
jgi:hypothetical protein